MGLHVESKQSRLFTLNDLGYSNKWISIPLLLDFWLAGSTTVNGLVTAIIVETVTLLAVNHVNYGTSVDFFSGVEDVCLSLTWNSSHMQPTRESSLYITLPRAYLLSGRRTLPRNNQHLVSLWANSSACVLWTVNGEPCRQGRISAVEVYE